MIEMLDSVNPAAIPKGTTAVAGYIDGHYPSFPGLLARFHGRAHLLSITVLGGHADCLDIEPGNPVPAAAAGRWVRAMLHAGVWRPCVYTFAAQMPEVQRALTGIPRSDYRLWLAEWPGTGAVVPTGMDAHQYQPHGPRGENFDMSVCAPDFFKALPAPPKHHRPLIPHPIRRRRRHHVCHA